jgi:hypothetical protein
MWREENSAGRTLVPVDSSKTAIILLREDSKCIQHQINVLAEGPIAQYRRPVTRSFRRGGGKSICGVSVEGRRVRANINSTEYLLDML